MSARLSHLNICKPAVAAGMGAPGPSTPLLQEGLWHRSTTSTKQHLHKEGKKTQQMFRNNHSL